LSKNFPGQAISNSGKNRGMKTVLLLIGFILSPIKPAEAQQPGKVARVGYVSVRGASSQAPLLEAFKQGLRELGYIEGKNVIIEYRFAEGKRERVPSMVSELVHLKVDVIVSGGAGPTRAAKQATITIPTVRASG
jgi:putative tryptophan/tyrosine transport system substrate-binding protein